MKTHFFDNNPELKIVNDFQWLRPQFFSGETAIILIGCYLQVTFMKMCSRPVQGLYLILLVLIADSLSIVMAQPPRESQLKAVYLLRFTRFIEWPADVFKEQDSPFYMCITGENPFGGALELAIEDEFYEAHPIQIHNLTDANFLKECHILYLSDSLTDMEENHLMDMQKNYPVLTVSERKNFARRGGMIEFYNASNKVRFFINPKTIRDTGIWISANLLRVGDIIDSDTN